MIDFELYKIFKIVADEGNLTKASEKLHISQPAVTKHIKNLENSLDVKLFTRSKFGMTLTENGKKLYDKINDSINILSSSEEIFDENKIIKLGVHTNMPEYIYQNSISEFYQTNSSSIINIHKLNAKSTFAMLENQEIDLAFSKKYSEDIYDSSKIKFIKIGELHDTFIVRNDSKYLNMNLSNFDLKNIPIYTLKKFSSAYQNLFNSLGYTSCESTNIENIDFTGIMELLKHRDIIALITKEYVLDKLNNNELIELNTNIKIENSDYGIYYNINNYSKIIKKLITIFKNNK